MVSLADELIELLRKHTNTPTIQFKTPPIQLVGGKETKIYEFKIQNQPSNIPNHLILRILPQNYRPDQAIITGTLHNYLSNQGYPTPKVHLTSIHQTIQGSQFLVMDYIDGDTAYEKTSDKTGKQVAEICHKLHKIDPEPLLRQYKTLGIPESRYTGLDWREEYIEKQADWLKLALDWVIDNYPADKVKPSICHGEFHTLNVMVKDDRVVSVLDWSTFRIEDFHYDLASLRNLCNIMCPVYYEGYTWGRFFNDFLDEYKLLGGFDQELYEYFLAYLSFFMYTWGVRLKNSISHPQIMKGLSKTFEDRTNISLEKSNR